MNLFINARPINVRIGESTIVIDVGSVSWYLHETDPARMVEEFRRNLMTSDSTINEKEESTIIGRINEICQTEEFKIWVVLEE
jgi:hypothetical protein